MRNLIILLCFSCSLLTQVHSQVGIEAQLGGANFLGLSINSRYSIPIDQISDQRLSPSFGIGVLAPWWDEPTIIINMGLSYTYKKWGAGIEVASFLDAPYKLNTTKRNWVDFILYPNLNFTGLISPSFYYRLSAGPYLAYTKILDEGGALYSYRFEGDVIPGVGVTAGYLFR